MRKRPTKLSLYLRLETNLFMMPGFVLATIFFGSLALVSSLFDKSGRMQHRIAQIWARVSVACSRSRVKVVGAENLTKCPVAVYAANHTSYMDTPVVFSTLPFQFRILAKKELWKVPFIGWYLNRSGQVPIDTGGGRSTLASLNVGVKALKDGMPLFVFPEGGRTPDGQLQKFFSGAAFLAIRAQAPIVPIALVGIYDLLPIHTRHYYPTDLTVKVGEPIPTEGLAVRQAEELTEQVRQAIQALLDAPVPNR